MEVSYTVQHKKNLKRSPLSLETFNSYAQAIENNEIAKFGVVKMSSFELDIRFEKTLLEYSVLHRRDKITLQLLQAGANPSKCEVRFTEEFYDKIMQLLWGKSPAHAVFIANLGIQLRLNSSAGFCEQCDKQRIVGVTSCGHSVCQVCYWTVILTLPKFGDPHCPVCSHEMDDPLAIYVSELDMKSDIRALALQTKYKFDQMPETVVVGQKQSFQALPHRIACTMYLGTYKKQRSEVLLSATYAGDYRRVEAVIRAGVDLNAQNEYGQTALFIACWKQYHDIVELLLDCGTTMMTPDNAGVFPEDVLHPFVDYQGLTTQNGSVECISIDHPTLPKMYQFDNFFSSKFLDKLLSIYEVLPIEKGAKQYCNDRKYFCDSLGIVQHAFSEVLGTVAQQVHTMAHMRFLVYQHEGGAVTPHIDLSRTVGEVSSTHTFILYLKDCAEGGETNILDRIPTKHQTCTIVRSIKPKYGRMVIFPHHTPHEGLPVISVPKVLLRGELSLSLNEE
jgi:hypothetical protein